MRVDVKKMLFVGLEHQRETFFTEMQKIGVVHFNNMRPKKGVETPQHLLDLSHAIKVILSYPPQDQEERENLAQAMEIVNEVNSLSHQMEALEEERRVGRIEMARMEVFGNFDLEQLAAIEKKGSRHLQFFCAKKGLYSDNPPAPFVLYVGSDHGLDYFFSVAKEPFHYEGMVEMHFESSLSTLKRRDEEIDKQWHECNKKLHELAKYNDFLHTALVHAINEQDLVVATDYAKTTLDDHLFAVTGFVPVDKIDTMREMLQKHSIHWEEVEVDEKEAIPTYLENKGTARIGEDLVHIYDTPSHEDKDPSLWVLFSFALFFGIIIGDAGYGLIFLAVTLYLRYRLGQVKAVGKRVLQLMTLLCVSCVIWGTLTHSFLGFPIAIDSPLRNVSLLNTLIEKKADYHYHFKDATYEEWVKQYPQIEKATSGHEMLLTAVETKGDTTNYEMMDKFTNSILLELALVIGIVHLILSFARYLDRTWSGYGWIAALIGSYCYVPTFLKASSLLMVIFMLPSEVVAFDGAILMGGGLALAVVLSIIQNKWLGILELTNVIQIFADVLSYLRLYALALAGGILSQTINSLVGQLPFVLGILIFVFGHAINMALSIMSGVIHGLRLNFLEWYHYSFEGGGKLFKPLKLLNKE